MLVGLLLAATLSGAVTEDIDVSLPDRVDVLPVFFVPLGEVLPTREQKLKLMKHIQWAQKWYREALGNRDTFRVAKAMPDVYRAKNPFAFYRNQPPGEGITYASHFVGELLDHYGKNRFNCPYVFAIVFMSPKEHFPIGGGRPLNGGLNRGGGMLNMSSWVLDRTASFQSTLRHELGHAFGLVHVDAYQYDMTTTPSMMAYNAEYRTKGFEESTTPARFIAEDIRGLAINKRCFAKLEFDPVRDNAEGKKPHRVLWLGPMDIVGQPPHRIEATTTSGETYGSHVANIVHKPIRPSKTPERGQAPGSNFDPATMWNSAEATNGWVSLDLTFPFPVTLKKIGVHTQHSGQYHAASAVRLEVGENNGFRNVVEQPTDAVDAQVEFPPTRGRTWRLSLRAGRSKMVCVRGLQFFNESGEIFPPLVPFKTSPEKESASGVSGARRAEAVAMSDSP